MTPSSRSVRKCNLHCINYFYEHYKIRVVGRIIKIESKHKALNKNTIIFQNIKYQCITI